jgi:TonB family protein
MRTLILITSFVVATLLCPNAPAQSSTNEVKHFAEGGLAFDYPAGWTLTDKSHAQAQHLALTREGSPALIMVVAQRDIITTPAQLMAAHGNVRTPLIEIMAQKLGITKKPVGENTDCLKIGERVASGFRLRGRLNGQPGIGEIYTAILGGRSLNLVYVRAEGDETQSGAAWKLMLDTLRIDEPADGSGAQLPQIMSGGVLNGRVLKKPAPSYPDAARAARAQGTVVVQIVLDENGQVISAQAISGHPALREASEKAARQAKFSSTNLCGLPVRVSGVITYNYVLM